MFTYPKTLLGPVTLLSVGLVGLVVAGSAVSATQHLGAAKADRLPLTKSAINPDCGTQTWPNIENACLERVSTGSKDIRRFRTIAVERVEKPNTSILVRIPVTD